MITKEVLLHCLDGKMMMSRKKMMLNKPTSRFAVTRETEAKPRYWRETSLTKKKRRSRARRYLFAST